MGGKYEAGQKGGGSRIYFFLKAAGAAEKQRSGIQRAANTELGVGVSQASSREPGTGVGQATDREATAKLEGAATEGRGAGNNPCLRRRQTSGKKLAIEIEKTAVLNCT